MFYKNKYKNIAIKILFVFFDFIFFKKNKNLWVIAISPGERFDNNIRAIYENFEIKNIRNNVNLKVISHDKHLSTIVEKDGVKWGSVKHFWIVLNAGVIIYHHNIFDTGLIALPINRINYRVSHGIHYKKVERAERGPSSWYEAMLSTKNLIPFHGVSSKQDAISAVCYFHIFLHNVDVTGCAKNDIVIGRLDSNFYIKQDNSLKRLLNGRKLITYAPTWRSDGCAYDFDTLEVEKLNNFLIENNFVFGYAGHQYLRDRKVPALDSFIDLNSLEIDVQIILRNTEVLITDYSSIWIDFLLKDKPIIFFQYDKDDYKEERGLLFDSSVIGIESVVLDVDMLIKAINIRGLDKKHEFLKDYFHAYKDGNNTMRTVSAIHNRINKC
jgi:hypothetical protein